MKKAKIIYLSNTNIKILNIIGSVIILQVSILSTSLDKEDNYFYRQLMNISKKIYINKASLIYIYYIFIEFS